MGKTYGELILDLENALKVEGNLNNWSRARREECAERIAKIRHLLAGHLEREPSKRGSSG